MQGPSWIALFQRIPAKLQDSISLTLATGAEIIVQSVFRLESDYVILRGRLAGSTDAGRVILLPYDQLVHLAFTKRMNEPEVEGLFGASFQFTGVAAAGTSVAAAPDASAEPAPAQPAASPAASTDTPSAPQPTEETPARAAAVPLATTLRPSPPPPATAGSEKGKAPPPSKSILLARLRARLAEQGK